MYDTAVTYFESGTLFNETFSIATLCCLVILQNSCLKYNELLDEMQTCRCTEV